MSEQGAEPGPPPPEPVRLADGESVAEAVRNPARLAALDAAELLDTGGEESFDRLTRLAAELMSTPVSLVSLVDEHRQYFKSAVGLPEPLLSRRETPLSHSICQYVVAADGPLAIGDTSEIGALHGNRAPAELGVAAYAGVPIRGPRGEVYGSFCVIDSQPRRWSVGQLQVMEELAAAAAWEIALRSRLNHVALHDPLTGLANRDRFLAHLEESLGDAQGHPVAVLVIEVDGLDAINASLGRRGADTMLVGIATRLKEGMPDAFIASVGEDRFALAFARLSGERAALQAADRVRELLAAHPFDVQGHALHAYPSTGIALGDGRDSAEALLEGAVTAVRQAKQAPERVRALGGERLRQDAVDRLRTENALRFAIQGNRLEVFYQPKVRLADRSLIGFEALLRWQDPDLGSIPPSTFIPIAEANGLITPLGQFVLAEACGQAAEWRSVFPQLDLSMAVNLSPRQIQESDIAALVGEALAQSSLPANRLTLEITESALMRSPTDQAATLRRLSELGVAVDLDDFGTGYSSLSRLATLPLDALKIDRSFVSGLGDERMEAIVQSIIALAAALGLQVTAEGVETEAQLDQIRAMGCDVGQGYLFAAPQPAAALRGLLEQAQVARTRARPGSTETLPTIGVRAA